MSAFLHLTTSCAFHSRPCDLFIQSTMDGHVKWSESCSVMSDSSRPHGLYSPWNSSGQNTGVGSLSLRQRIFPTQGLSPGLPHCRRILHQLSQQGRPDTHVLFPIFWSSNSGVCTLGHVYLFSHLGHAPPTPAKCYRFLLTWKTLQSPRGRTEYLPDATWAHCFPLCWASVSHLQMGTDKLPSSSGTDDANVLSKL